MAASLLVAGAAFARDAIDDGHLQVRPAKNNMFSTGEFIMGKAELYGYLGDLKDSKKITGIVLQDADRATPEQKHLLVIAAQAQKLDALVEDHGKLEPLVDPTVPTPVVAPSAPAQ
ncbi:MAG: hypothetical protein DYH18_11440 [Xanthomonadales bacterium PRO7]|nr:hypothetical protein [Xanthomonadales bacterium PRO7]